MAGLRDQRGGRFHEIIPEPAALPAPVGPATPGRHVLDVVLDAVTARWALVPGLAVLAIALALAAARLTGRHA
jgi:hypothetical protein